MILMDKKEKLQFILFSLMNFFRKKINLCECNCKYYEHNFIDRVLLNMNFISCTHNIHDDKLVVKTGLGTFTFDKNLPPKDLLIFIFFLAKLSKYAENLTVADDFKLVIKFPNNIVFNILTKPSYVEALYKVFVKNEYNLSLDEVEGKNVLDIGAFFGDSSILFYKLGAKKIVAIEPSEFPYNLLVENIYSNGLANKIIPLKLYIGSGDMKADNKSDFVTTVKYTANDREMTNNIETLEKLLIADNDNLLIKIDCEGCEKVFFTGNEYSDLIRNSRIIVGEIHSNENLVLVRESLSRFKFREIKIKRKSKGFYLFKAIR